MPTHNPYAPIHPIGDARLSQLTTRQTEIGSTHSASLLPVSDMV